MKKTDNIEQQTYSVKNLDAIAEKLLPVVRQSYVAELPTYVFETIKQNAIKTRKQKVYWQQGIWSSIAALAATVLLVFGVNELNLSKARKRLQLLEHLIALTSDSDDISQFELEEETIARRLLQLQGFENEATPTG